MALHLSQWNDPARRQPPKPRKVSSRPANSSHAECPQCHSQNLRPAGWFTSRRYEERHQDVQCRECGRYSRLDVGVVLPKKEFSSPARIVPDVLIANDPRPSCPHCGGHRIQRRDRQRTGRRRWYCADCDRRFVADESAAFLDHRKAQHFEEDDPQEEAEELFRSAKRVGANFQEMRETIGYTEAQRRCLQFLADQGLLASGNVEAMLSFRDRVLEKFNNLVDAELAVLAEKIGEQTSLPLNHAGPAKPGLADTQTIMKGGPP